MLSIKEVDLLRKELQTAKNPLFLFDADGDGLAAFLLLYRIYREGKGIRVTMTSKIDLQFMRRVEEINPDKIFVLDIPLMDQEFVDQVKRPIFWIDHHQPQEISKVQYFNPRIKDPNAYIPTTRMAYQVSGHPEDLWIATAGCLADYHLPDFIDRFIKEFPELLDQMTDLPTIIFKRPVSRLVKLFFFLQNGPSSEVRKSIKVLSRIKHPNEIFKQENPAGKFLYKRFELINQKYEQILMQAKKQVTSSKLLLFLYEADQWSFTANLANELSSTYPKKVIIIARNKSGEYKCSLRARFAIDKALTKALDGLQGKGGGHPNACGAVVKEENWELFLNRFKEEIKQLSE